MGYKALVWFLFLGFVEAVAIQPPQSISLRRYNHPSHHRIRPFSRRTLFSFIGKLRGGDAVSTEVHDDVEEGDEMFDVDVDDESDAESEGEEEEDVEEAVSIQDNEDEEEDEDDDEETDDEEEDDDATDQEDDKDLVDEVEQVISAAPVTVSVKTNMGNVLIDTSLEKTSSRKKTVEEFKKGLSKEIRGRPPHHLIRLRASNEVLSDDQLMSEVFEDHGEKDDENETESLTLILDMIPPVDPKFGIDLMDRFQDMTTNDLLSAYTANAAAMAANGRHLIGTDEDDKQDDDEMVTRGLRENAFALRDDILKSFPADLAEKADSDAPSQQKDAVSTVQKRGQRARTLVVGKNSASSMKQTVQRNINIVS